MRRDREHPTLVAHSRAISVRWRRVGDRLEDVAHTAAATSTVDSLRNAAAGIRRELLQRPGGYCSPRPIVTGVRVRGREVTFDWVPEDHAVVRAIGTAEQSGVAPPWMWVGLDTVVTTADDRVLVSVRSPRADGPYGGRANVPVCEGIDLNDIPDHRTGAPDLLNGHAAIARGLREELGVHLPRHQVNGLTRLHTVLQVSPCSLTLVAHADLTTLGLTAADVLAAARHAPDAWEHAALHARPLASAPTVDEARTEPARAHLARTAGVTDAVPWAPVAFAASGTWPA